MLFTNAKLIKDKCLTGFGEIGKTKSARPPVGGYERIVELSTVECVHRQIIDPDYRTV
jgi:hypothetical protein